ncbi:MAG: HAD-IIB family hydrolase [Candidatus Levybacteria bacterium]|nr:HAD-IIB family hydrolase [Candidatus Levybacteria bacterium]
MTESIENLAKIDVTPKALVIENEGLKKAVWVLSDIDGTVNDEGEIESERIYTIEPAKEAFRELEQRGISVGLITARSFAEAEEYQTKLLISGNIVCEDGAVIVLPKSASTRNMSELIKFGKIETHEGRVVLLPKGDLEKSPITTEDIKNLIEEVELSTKTRIISSCTSAPDELRVAAKHATLEAAKLSQDRLASAYAVNLTEEQRELAKDLSDSKGIRTFTNPVDKITMFFPKGVNKGHAVDILLEITPLLYPSLNVEGTFLIAIGNNNNDSPFLKKADIAVVVRKKNGDLAILPENIPQGTIIPNAPFSHGVKEAVSQILEALKPN